MNKKEARKLYLQNQIDLNSKKMDKIKAFVPITNCELRIDGADINIHELQSHELLSLLVKIEALVEKADSLEVLDTISIDGYKITDWASDIRNKIKQLSKKARKEKIKELEKELQQYD